MDARSTLTVVSKDDSYTERRKLFKNIWEKAVDMDENEPESGTKPKVIKTLRLGEKDGVNIGKSKKQRIKNLRTVCTRLLDFCDRQDAADFLFDEMSAACENASNNSAVFTLHQPVERKKKYKKKRKVQQTYSYVRPHERRQDKPKTSFDLEVTEGSVTHRGTRPFRDMHSPRLQRATLIQKFLNERYNLEKAPPAPTGPSASEQKLQVGDALCKVVKKKHRKRKKVAPIPSPTRATSAHMKKVRNGATKRKKVAHIPSPSRATSTYTKKVRTRASKST